MGGQSSTKQLDLEGTSGSGERGRQLRIDLVGPRDLLPLESGDRVIIDPALTP